MKRRILLIICIAIPILAITATASAQYSLIPRGLKEAMPVLYSDTWSKTVCSEVHTEWGDPWALIPDTSISITTLVDCDLTIIFSTECKLEFWLIEEASSTSDDLRSPYEGMMVRALVDGSSASPTYVYFLSPTIDEVGYPRDYQGRTFTFVLGGVPKGTHTIGIEWQDEGDWRAWAYCRNLVVIANGAGHL